MSDLRKPTDGLLFSSLLFRSDIHSLSDIESTWSRHCPSISKFGHQFYPMMDYYKKEMGAPLTRLWFFSQSVQSRNKLIEDKLWATKWENETADNGRRTINCDVGLVLLDQMILATGKPYNHRVYLDQGVFADLTYIYKGSSYETLPWSYPDYAKEDVIEKFNLMRGYLLHLVRGYFCDSLLHK